MTLTIRPARAADLDAALALIDDAGLPVADLAAGLLAFVAEKQGEFQGVVGLESYGELALLRSLAVAPAAQGRGVGPALLRALEAACRAAGITELWLLTIDAKAFFVKLGYRERDRADAPDAIRTTAEFSSLCPGDAVLMSKTLDQGRA